MSEFASSAPAPAGAAVATAENGDWKESCVRPPKDTRVQTAVSMLVVLVPIFVIHSFTGCYRNERSRI